jgi:hypothetical protein
VQVSEFWNLVNGEFGEAYATSLSKSLVLAGLDDCTVLQAIEQGQNLRRVWHAVCDAMDVPTTRREVQLGGLAKIRRAHDTNLSGRRAPPCQAGRVRPP